MRNKNESKSESKADLNSASPASDGTKTAKAPRLFHLLAQARQNLFRSADALFTSELGYSGTQIVALFALKGEEGCQLKELGQQLQLKNSAVTGLVTRMEENGLIVRTQSALDARAGALHLSDKGRRVLAKALPLLDSLNRQLKQGFTVQELSIVARFLGHASQLQFEKENAS